MHDIFIPNFQYHTKLMPRLWGGADGFTINHLAAQSLQMMAWELVRYMRLQGLQLPDEKILDIMVYGSSVNYFWDSNSDIDIKIIADMSDITDIDYGGNWRVFCRDFILLWKHTFYLSIFGRRVDISISDVNTDARKEFLSLGGCYSLMHGRWISYPDKMSREHVRVVKKMTRRRIRVMVRQLRALIRSGANTDDVDDYVNVIQLMRDNSTRSVKSACLITSTGMSYRMLRNNGVFLRARKVASRRNYEKFVLK